MEPVTHVILGPGKCFHGIDEEMTKFYRSVNPAVPAMVAQYETYMWAPAYVLLWRLMHEAGLIKSPEPSHQWGPDSERFRRFVDLHHAYAVPGDDQHRDNQWLTHWDIRNAAPLCKTVGAGPPVPIETARARGMDFSTECAKKLGVYHDGRPPLVRAETKLRSRAFVHAVECETCQHEGVAKCRIFSLLATGQIESDVDPKLEELLD